MNNKYNQIDMNLANAGSEGGIEAGHYYECFGPTLMSLAGWTIKNDLMQPGNKNILFIDDVHTLGKGFASSESEWPKTSLHPALDTLAPPDITVLESVTKNYAPELISLATKANLTKLHQNKIMFKQGWFPLSIDGEPTCLAMDAALSAMKILDYKLKYLVNILPWYYKGEQTNLGKVQTSIFPLLGIASDSWALDSITFSKEEAEAALSSLGLSLEPSNSLVNTSSSFSSLSTNLAY